MLVVTHKSFTMDDMNVLNGVMLDESDRQYIYAVVRRIVRSEDAAADVTQDTLLLAHRHRDQFRGDSAHRTWLYRIAVTTALGFLRRQRRSREELAGAARELAAQAPDPRPDPEQVLVGRELARRVEEMLDGVAPQHREVFELRAADVPEAEIAQALGISIANVKIRAHRVRGRLREGLEDYGVTPAPPASRARPGSPADTGATSQAS